VAYKAIACYYGGHLHAMDIACCAALGVPDTPVQQLQAVPCSKEGGKGGCQYGEYMSFHVYEYKTSLRKDGKERRRLELVQKHCKIGKFHRLHYWPALGRERYHMTSYLLAARCRKERRMISHGSISSHHNYGERMPLSFNNKIQSEYYQNCSVSVEGASLEWVDAEGVRHTQYFGHWSDNSKQDTAATMRNMQSKLCVDGNVTQLVEGLNVGGTVWKGMDGAADSYCCGKSI
jgi:hypothetical protein